MSASSTHPLPPDPASPTTGSVRRHHTISAHSRSARTNARDVISEETQEQQQAIWNDDEVVDQDWVGGVGAVGEKTSLHRQSSLPTRYHRGFQNQGSNTGTHTPRTINSLAAIAGNEADEEPWKVAASYDVHDDEPTEDGHGQHQQVVDIQSQSQSSGSPLSPHFGAHSPHAPSPPPATGVRRHVSLTYGAGVGGPRKMNTGLKRSGTLQATLHPHSQASAVSPDTREQADEEEYSYEIDETTAYEEEYYNQQQQPQQPQQQQQQQQQYAQNSMGRSSPWSSTNEWRQGYGNTNNNGNVAIDDVQRALSALEIASNQAPGLSMPQASYGNYQPQGQATAPPRFSTTPSGSGYRNGGNANYNNAGGNINNRNNDFDGRKTPQSQQRGGFGQQGRDDRTWDQQNLRTRSSNPNMQYGYQQGGHMKSASGGNSAGSGSPNSIPSVPPIPQQYLQQGGQTSRPGVGVATNFASNTNPIPTNQSPVQPFINAPIDVPSLIATKGYNPANFDIHPQFARYFVIKSYTEDDVHKSLKYEIWSSTDPGNKRLDKAFKDTAARGPIYLFFSVNASGHFCGMAEMLTPVDYTKSSTVWASDKWKGVFKVRWIFVRDIPNLNLRHIKLNNTLERKPVTNSRDTQELLPDAGQEMLKIFHTHPARTSLLQDFAFYEVQAMQKMQATSATATPAHSSLSSPQMPVTSMPVPNPGFNNNYNIMQMGLGMNPSGGGNGNGQYSGHQGLQAMHQSVMRNPSPASNQQGQGYMGF